MTPDKATAIQAGLDRIMAMGVDSVDLWPTIVTPVLVTAEQLAAIKQCPGLDVQEHSDAMGQAWLTVSVKSEAAE